MPTTTINEVARHAGVSPSTVSYVLNGTRSISEKTQERVRRSIAELNYKPHAGARSLRAGKTDVVALVVPIYDWASEPALMPFVYGIIGEAREYGWNVMLVTGGDGGADVDSVVRSKMVDGVVLMEVRVGDERLRVIEQLGVPAVALGMPLETVSIPFVDLDFEAAGRVFVEHLTSLGHQHIGLLASPPGTFKKRLGYAHRLWRGVTGAMAAAGLDFHGVPVEPTMEGAQRALDALLQEQPEMSALIVQTETVTDLVMPSLQQRGLSVPEDISVVALARRELIKHVVPPLTYVHVPSVEIGRKAIELLATGGPGVLLPATLVRGGTVAPPRTT